MKSSTTDDNGQGGKTIAGYYYEELGCQRKGVKKEFYDRYRPDEFIFTKEELNELMTYVDEEHQNSFKTDLIDKFIEGDTIVWIGY